MAAARIHAAASRAYGRVQVSATLGRVAEAEAFARAAALLADARVRRHDRSVLARALEFNHKLWRIMEAEATDPRHPAPEDVKRDMRALAAFMEQSTARALAAARPRLDAMIQVNASLSRGLFSR